MTKQCQPMPPSRVPGLFQKGAMKEKNNFQTIWVFEIVCLTLVTKITPEAGFLVKVNFCLFAGILL